MNTVSKALLALVTLATLVPAYGMHTFGLKRSFTLGANPVYKRAVYGTLGSRLLASNPRFSSTFKPSYTPMTLTPAKSKPGFFGKLFGFIGLSGFSLWSTEEEKCANDILRHPAVNQTLTTPAWNLNHPVVGQKVFERCRIGKLSATDCGLLYRKTQDALERKRLNKLGILDEQNQYKHLSKAEQLQANTNRLALNFTQYAMASSIKNDDGTTTPVAQASNEQLANILSSVETKFTQCAHEETKKRLCNPARLLAQQHLQAFRDAAQGSTPAVAVAKPTE